MAETTVSVFLNKKECEFLATALKALVNQTVDAASPEPNNKRTILGADNLKLAKQLATEINRAKGYIV